MDMLKKLSGSLTLSKTLRILACILSSFYLTVFVDQHMLNPVWLCLPIFAVFLTASVFLSCTAVRLFKATLKPWMVLLSIAVAILILIGCRDFFFPSRQKVYLSLTAETTGEICLCDVIVDGENIPVRRAKVVENSGWLYRGQWDNFMIWPEEDGTENSLIMCFLAEEVRLGFPYTPYAGSVAIESSAGEGGIWDLRCPEWAEGEEVEYADLSFDCRRVFSPLDLLLYGSGILIIIVFLCLIFFYAVSLFCGNGPVQMKLFLLSRDREESTNRDMDKKKSCLKRISKALGYSVFAITGFFLLLVFFSEKWYLNTWDSSIEFSAVVYQVFSPLKGTGPEVMRSYIENSVFKAVAVMALFSVAVFVTVRYEFFCEIQNKEHKVRFALHIPHRKIFFRFGMVIIFVVMCQSIWTQAVEMGVEDYIEQVTENTAIFDEEYVSPGDVAISFPGERRNLVLIYLESMETTYGSVEAGGGKPVNYIPELTDLAFDNLFFSNDEDFGGACQVSGTGWTIAALLAGSAGVPYKLDIGENSAGKYEEFLPGLISMGDILLENGYRNYFMCGSHIAFAGREDFFRQHGDYTLIDLSTAREEGFVCRDYQNGFWGIEDEKLFAYAEEKLSEISATGTPFNFTLLTVDTHHPDGYICGSCEEQYEQQFANVLACSSRQTAAFVAWIQEQEWYEDTTVIIVGDHLGMKKDFWDDIGDYDRKIYNCFINLPENLSATRAKNRVFTALDLFPSVLTAVGAEIEGDRLGLGVNLFSDEETVPERMGIEAFDYELGLYSVYYFRHFIVGM